VNEPTSTQTLPYVPPGHPVRRFVVAIAVVAALLAVVWWSGIGRPDLSVQWRTAGPNSATLVLTNESRSSLDLHEVSFEDPRLEGETVDLPEGSLSGGESLELVVRYQAICTPAPPGGYYLPLRVTAETAIGLERTVNIGNVSTVGNLACDASTDAPE
jgi:hypothetical protein